MKAQALNHESGQRRLTGSMPACLFPSGRSYSAGRPTRGPTYARSGQRPGADLETQGRSWLVYPSARIADAAAEGGCPIRRVVVGNLGTAQVAIERVARAALNASVVAIGADVQNGSEG